MWYVAKSSRLVSLQTASTMCRTDKYYKNLIKSNVPDAFPIEIQDGFTTVESKSTKTTIISINKNDKQGGIRSRVNAIQQMLANSSNCDNRWYCVIFGRGGRRAAGVYFGYQGPGQPKYLTQGVSGALVIGFDSQASAIERFNLSYPFINSYDDLENWRRSISHLETNLSPTWPNYDGQIYHSRGARAYPYVEHDSEELFNARYQATFNILGSYDYEGVIDRRQLMFPENWHCNLVNLPPPGFDNVPPSDNVNGDITDAANENTMNDDDEAPPNSQDLPMQDAQRDTSDNSAASNTNPKRRKVPVVGDEEAENAARQFATNNDTTSKKMPTIICNCQDNDFFAVVFPLPNIANTLF